MSSPVPIVFILAGGSGERLYPISTEAHPKQLLTFNSDRTILETTLERFQAFDHRYILTTAKLKQTIQAQYPHEQLICEPYAKNTAPAIFEALRCLKLSHDALLIITPSDHWVEDCNRFQDALNQMLGRAKETDLPVFLGVKPTYASSNYGYICSKEKKFIEKPDPQKAQDLIKSDGVFWNSGVVCLSVKVLKDLFSRFYSPLSANFSELPRLSIDHAIFEHLSNFELVELHSPWEDFGNFESLERQNVPLSLIK